MDLEKFLRAEFRLALWGAKLLRIFFFRKTAENIESLFWKAVKTSSDSVTGLVLRTFFFERLMETLKAKFPEFDSTGKFPDLKQTDVNVVVGDSAFLAYFNNISHVVGDEVLMNAAQGFKKYFNDSWVARAGGDEFAAYTMVPVSQVSERIAQVRKEVSQKPLQYLDLGYASLQDVQMFFEIYDAPTERRIKTVANVLVEIAMTRAQISKIYERVHLFIDLYHRHDGSYEELVGIARKGAAGVEDAQIAEWAIRYEAGENIAPECLIFALEEKLSAIRRHENYKNNPPRHEAIFAVAEKFFFEQ